MYILVALVTVAVNLAAGVADLAKANFVLANSDELGLPRGLLPLLAWLKIAGAAGVVAGFVVWPLGIAAAAGLTLFFVGAVAVHVRAGVWRNMGYPLACLALAAGTLVLTAAAR